jgi:phosphate:Na+ symporter
MHQADVVESMLIACKKWLKPTMPSSPRKCAHLEGTVDDLYSAIKYYMTKISRAELTSAKVSAGRKSSASPSIWSRSATSSSACCWIWKTRRSRRPPVLGRRQAGILHELTQHLLDNLRLAMKGLLNGNVREAQNCSRKSALSRSEPAYSATHLERLSQHTVSSIETSSLHIDMISDLKRINSLLCSVAYPILEQAGALAPSRLKSTALENQR